MRIYLGHFVVEWNLLVGRGLVGGENPTHDVGPGSGSAHVGELFEAEGFNDVVEVGGRIYGKAPQEHGPRFSELGVQVRFLGFDSFGQGGESEGKRRWRRYN